MSRDTVQLMMVVALFSVLSPLYSAAPQYTARRAGDVVLLEDAKNQTVVSILPSVGNITFSMKVRGQEILRWPYASVEEFKARPGLSGIPFIGPWANRLDEPGFYANGKKYAFDMSLGNVRGTIPIHGFLTTNDQWQVVEVKADSKSAWITSRLEFFKQPLWMKQFPFAHTIEITHRLQDGVLQVQTKIINMSAEAMPVAIGFHPYYKLTDSTREEWTISVPVRKRWILLPTKIPSGETEPIENFFPNPQAAALKDYNLDDVFSDLVRDAQGRAHVVLKGKQQQLDIMIGPNWPALVMWSPNPKGTGRGSNGPVNPNPRGGSTQNDPNFIAFEPMAGITNGMNLAQKGLYSELQSIAPGGKWEASFWIKPSGF
jgi:aldose 1-epimerase